MHTSHLTSTQSQIATLEQQMHAVETANLNVETLKVMKSASNAMKVIHGGMNVDKVDETMYVLYFSYHMRLAIGMLDGGRRLDFPRTEKITNCTILYLLTGKKSESSSKSPRKSIMQSSISEIQPTRRSSGWNLRRWSRKHWTTRCSQRLLLLLHQPHSMSAPVSLLYQCLIKDIS